MGFQSFFFFIENEALGSVRVNQNSSSGQNSENQELELIIKLCKTERSCIVRWYFSVGSSLRAMPLTLQIDLSKILIKAVVNMCRKLLKSRSRAAEILIMAANSKAELSVLEYPRKSICSHDTVVECRPAVLLFESLCRKHVLPELKPQTAASGTVWQHQASPEPIPALF